MSYDSMWENKSSSNGAITEYRGKDLKTTQVARNVCKLPKNMTPSKEVLESLGFVFEDIGDPYLYQTTLPIGWTIRPDGNCWTTLVDSRGHTRGGYFFYTKACERGAGEILLFHRFSVVCDYTKETCVNTNNRYSRFKKRPEPVRVLVKDTDGNIIFDAGRCTSDLSVEGRALLKKADAFLNKHYPDFENPVMYWDK